MTGLSVPIFHVTRSPPPTPLGVESTMFHHPSSPHGIAHNSHFFSRNPSNSMMDIDADASPPPFFVPSYLRGSRLADRLEDAYRAQRGAQHDECDLATAGSPLRGSLNSNHQTRVSSYRGTTYDIVERERPWPMRWSHDAVADGLELPCDGLEVRCNSLGKSGDAALSVRTDHPMPRQCGLYYYEVAIMGRAKEAPIGIGFSGPGVVLYRLPGWEPDSWGYHGDDGHSFCCTSSGKAYGPSFSASDVIGCGVNFRTNTAFFTKNGVHLGVAFKSIPTSISLYPCLGMKKNGDHVHTNFGQHPFVFDIDGEYKKEQRAVQAEISLMSGSSLEPGLDEKALIHQLVAQCLAHDGYLETARAFTHEVKDESFPLTQIGGAQAKDLEPHEDTDLVNRQNIRAAILAGDIDKALKLTTACYPNVLRDNESIYFQLRCRKFIEMIRRCQKLQHRARKTQSTNEADVHGVQMELDDPTVDCSPAIDMETLEYGRELKNEFSGDPKRAVKRTKTLETVFALMAYKFPGRSPLGYLLHKGRRVYLAEELNRAILESSGKPSTAALERLIQQAEVLVEDLAQDGGVASFINVRRDYLVPPNDHTGPN